MNCWRIWNALSCDVYVSILRIFCKSDADSIDRPSSDFAMICDIERITNQKRRNAKGVVHQRERNDDKYGWDIVQFNLIFQPNDSLTKHIHVTSKLSSASTMWVMTLRVATATLLPSPHKNNISTILLTRALYKIKHCFNNFILWVAVINQSSNNHQVVHHESMLTS